MKIGGISIANFDDNWCGTVPKNIPLPKGGGTVEPDGCGTGPRPFPIGVGKIGGGTGDPECGTGPRPIVIGGSGGGTGDPDKCGTGPIPPFPKGGAIFADRALTPAVRTFDANILTAKLNMR